MRFVVSLAILVAATVASFGQTLETYLELRKKHGITQAVGIQALETLIGERVVEIQGVVHGISRAGSSTILLVERSDGQQLSIRAPVVPDWLETGNLTPARLLVRAERKHEYSDLEAWLIGAATERSIAMIEREARLKAEREAAKRAARTTQPPASRSGAKTTTAADWNLQPHEAVPVYAGFIKNRNKKLSDQQALDIAQGIVGFSVKYGIDARLILAMVMVESGFNPGATSRAGAMGLGQLMPGTAKGMGLNNAYDTFQNLYATVRIVRGHIDKYHKQTGDPYDALVLALAAYNAGSGAVRKHGGVPPYQETQNYIEKVVAAYRALCGN
ncbi:MAG: lytic transglycosylase domain-containing protein [Fimbriimonadaceae bacterium]|nr:MAG: lytic transglycosylase domain-containing protein [Fimbriimonadaceae bacterium]